MIFILGTLLSILSKLFFYFFALVALKRIKCKLLDIYNFENKRKFKLKGCGQTRTKPNLIKKEIVNIIENLSFTMPTFFFLAKFH